MCSPIPTNDLYNIFNDYCYRTEYSISYQMSYDVYPKIMIFGKLILALLLYNRINSTTALWAQFFSLLAWTSIYLDLLTVTFSCLNIDASTVGIFTTVVY